MRSPRRRAGCPASPTAALVRRVVPPASPSRRSSPTPTSPPAQPPRRRPEPIRRGRPDRRRQDRGRRPDQQRTSPAQTRCRQHQAPPKPPAAPATRRHQLPSHPINQRRQREPDNQRRQPTSPRNPNLRHTPTRHPRNRHQIHPEHRERNQTTTGASKNGHNRLTIRQSPSTSTGREVMTAGFWGVLMCPCSVIAVLPARRAELNWEKGKGSAERAVSRR